ncbi:hypothetical protein FJZ26_06195, partial [Candidatus Parvarchaeota archaeon]|nr:hypothetical protein [Candidatus Parvarchaeota archaeon]
MSRGSRVATARIQPFFGSEPLPDKQVKILAYIIAEGHLGNNFILFCNSDSEIVADFRESIAGFDSRLEILRHGKFNYHVVDHGRKRQIKKEFRDSEGHFARGIAFDRRNSLRKWLDSLQLYGKKSAAKFIPEVVFRLPREKLALFLNRLFSCDGSIYHNSMENSWRISYSSVSEQLARQVQHLLLRFGVVGILRWKKTQSKLGRAFELEIKGEFIETFIRNIGFFGQKADRQKVALLGMEGIRRNSNIDTIPKELWLKYKPKNWAAIGRAVGYAYPKAYRETTSYSTTREKLLQIATYEQNEMLLALSKSDIFWDEIAEIERINETVKVYDITVEDSHNFVANDIIVHNSYSMGVMAEEMANLPEDVSANLSIIMLDTMGVYWTMKYPNHA